MKANPHISWLKWSFVMMGIDWLFAALVLLTPRSLEDIRAALTICQLGALVAQIYCVYRYFRKTKTNGK